MNNKASYSLGVLVLSVVVIIFIQWIVLVGLYKRDKDIFISKVERVARKSIEQLNSESIKDSPQGFISCNKEYESLIIMKKGIKFIHKLDSTNDINSCILWATYDIRNLDSWNLERLMNIFQERMLDTYAPCIFEWIDDKDNLLGYYKSSNINSIDELSDKLKIKLGVLDNHYLIISYGFGWEYFWHLERFILLVIFFLLLVVVVCIFLFERIIQDGRRRVEEQELFIQALNHDMKSPMAELQMRLYQIRVLSQTGFTDEQEILYEISMRKYKEVRKAIDQLLLDSVGVKGLNLNLKPLNLCVLAQKQIDDLLSFVPEGKQVEFTTLFDAADILVWGDEHHLSRVITNLLKNAMKYSADEVNITVMCKREGNYASILVEDDGYGIEKKDFKHIFAKNYRANWYIGKRKVDGFGLGLSYAKMIVKAHHGNIRLVSEPGKGSIFIVDLPVYKAGNAQKRENDGAGE